MILDSNVRSKAFSIGRVLTGAAAVHVLYLFVGYVSSAEGLQRIQIESAATVFAVVAALTAVLGSLPRQIEEQPSPALAAEAVVWCLASALLYSSSIKIGLLSDDFVLVSRAARGEFSAVSAELFRPLPLIAWAMLLKVRAGAVGLHLLNIFMHGATAFLTRRLAAPYVSSPVLAAGAGLLVLTFPAAPEAVSWCAGIFDVAATTLCVVAVLVSRRYATRDRAADRILMFVCATMALLSKETAAVVPALIAFDAWARRKLSKRLVVDVSVLAAGLAVVGVYRLLQPSSMVEQPITKYVVQRWFFGTASALLVPWHVDVMHAIPWIAVLTVAAILAVVGGFAATSQERDRVRAALCMAAWPFVSTIPTLAFFFVSPDLQGSRYVYLAVVGYAVCLAILADGVRRATRVPFDLGIIAVIVVCGVIGTVLQERPWKEAGAVVTEVRAAAAADPRMHTCPSIALAGLPDNVRGAYVFRNGIDEALASQTLTVNPDSPPPCRFAWNASLRIFEHISISAPP